MSDIFIPYNLAKELDKHFGPLDMSDFINFVEAFQAAGNEKHQRKVAELFKTLPKKEAISRAHKISMLTQILNRIKLNRRHDLPSP